MAEAMADFCGFWLPLDSVWAASRVPGSKTRISETALKKNVMFFVQFVTCCCFQMQSISLFISILLV